MVGMSHHDCSLKVARITWKYAEIHDHTFICFTFYLFIVLSDISTYDMILLCILFPI